MVLSNVRKQASNVRLRGIALGDACTRCKQDGGSSVSGVRGLWYSKMPWRARVSVLPARLVAFEGVLRLSFNAHSCVREHIL